MNHLSQRAQQLKKYIKWRVVEDFTGALHVAASLGDQHQSYIIFKDDWKHCPNKKGLMTSIIKHLEYHILSRVVVQVAVSA